MIPFTEKLLLAYARRFPILKGKYRLVERFGRGRGDDSLRVAKLAYGGFTMECDLRKMLQRQFYFFGTYFLEERVLATWSRYARDAKVIFDVGANAGIYSLAAAAASPESEIHAFEPTPEIAAHLRATVSSNGIGNRLHIHEVAVGDRAELMFLNRFSGENDDNEGMNFVSDVRRAASSIEVPMFSLDVFCSERGLQGIDLLKVDVQGNEPAVFEGARGLIERGTLRAIFFELNWKREDRDRCPARQAVEMLSRAGYRFADPNGQMEPRDVGQWIETLSDVVAVR